MHDGSERLARDIDILTAMAGQMAEYLDSDVLFWPLGRGGMPMLTLGGYLFREERLLALAHLLTPEQRTQLDAAVFQFNQTLADRVVRFETKAHNELEARLRQWEESLKDIDRDTFDRTSNYSTVVETRLMIAALLNRLSMPPYRTEERPLQHLAALDTRLRNRWGPGEFVWPEEWAAAYPPADYWWLYGAPRAKSSK